MDKKTLGIILALIVSFTTVVVLDDKGVELDPTHYCESLELKMYCDRTTAMYCYPTEGTRLGSKKCSEGWKEIPKEEYSKQSGKQWRCNSKECIEVK